MLQGSLDTRFEERGRMKPSLEAGSGADELKAGHLAGIIELYQIGETPLKAAGQGIGQRHELPDNRIAAGVGNGTLQSGAAACSRHDGRSKGPKPLRVWSRGRHVEKSEAQPSQRTTGGQSSP
jgi:hypothetical protein